MRTGRAVALKGASDMLSRAVTVVLFPVVVHYADADGWGAYSQLLAIVGFLGPLLPLGLTSAVVPYLAPLPWNARSRRWLLGSLGGALAVAAALAGLFALLAAPVNDAILRWPSGDDLFRAGALLLVIGAAEAALLELLRAREWLGQYAAYQFGQTAMTAVAGFATLPASHGVVAFVVVTAALKLALLLANAAIVAARPVDAAPVVGTEPLALPRLGRMVRFGLPLSVAGLGLAIVHTGDRFVVGHYLSAADVGAYAAVYSMAVLITAGAGPVLLPALPKLVRSWAVGGSHATIADASVFHQYLALVVVVGAGWLSVLGGASVRLLSGGRIDPGFALVVTIVLALALDQWNGLTHYVLIAAGRTLFLQNAWLTAAAANIGANIVVVPRHGLLGAAVVTLLTFSLLEAALTWRAGREAPIALSYRLDTTAMAALAAGAGIAAGLPAVVLLDGPASQVAAGTLAFGLACGGVLMGTGTMRPGDVADLLRRARPGADATPLETHDRA